MSFTQTLEDNGWIDMGNSIKYQKGSWILIFDTSSWIEVGTTNNSRVFDVPVPEKRLEQWTVNLIEHLCTVDDALTKANRS